ncbi:unnamed protein product [Bemisia tabaci]|uniref:Uncharacterized protein n=1 Tax=Bemisia tabaci TaxID=7038 RepID=A0A9P0F3S4_BEMTA|nr:unnamed protein product [Bemisia tabaci]
MKRNIEHGVSEASTKDAPVLGAAQRSAPAPSLSVRFGSRAYFQKKANNGSSGPGPPTPSSTVARIEERYCVLFEVTKAKKACRKEAEFSSLREGPCEVWDRGDERGILGYPKKSPGTVPKRAWQRSLSVELIATFESSRETYTLPLRPLPGSLNLISSHKSLVSRYFPLRHCRFDPILDFLLHIQGFNGLIVEIGRCYGRRSQIDTEGSYW